MERLGRRVAWLGLTELRPLVQQVFLRGSIDPGWLTFRNFDEDLQYTVEHPDAEPLHGDGDLTFSAIPSRKCRGGLVSSRRRRATISWSWGRQPTSGCPTASPRGK